jgi:iron(III) transport system substrate-binding protein
MNMPADLERVSTALVFAVSSALFVHSVHSQTLQELAAYQGEDRQQRLIEGAKKEGSLLFYTTFPIEYANQLIEPFKSKYGIKVNVWRARSEIVLRKVISEARAGSLNVDVITVIAPAAEALRRENLLQEIHSPHHKDLIHSAVPAHREWAPTVQHVFVQAYNTDKVRKEDLPKSYQDLLAPKWKGKLAMEGDDHEWMSSVIADMGPAKGVRFFRDLVANNGLSVRSGHPLLTNLVASGEVPLALTVYQYSVEQAKKKGSPIDWFAIEPAVSIANGIGVAKGAPHPHAALLFYDYIIGPEAQRILAKIGYVPTNTKIESPVKGVKLKLLDAAKLLDEQERSFSLFEQIILKSAAR